MREKIASLVQSIQPTDEMEREHIAATLEWIASGAGLFRVRKPDVPYQHLVSYFVLVDPSVRRLLLVDHRLAGLWLPSGGHVEPGEHPQETVRREVREELGIDAAFLFTTPLFLTVTQTRGTVARHTDVSLWYVLLADCTKSLEFDAGEFHDIRWFALDNIPLERADPHMQRFVTKLRSRLMCEWT
jgi:8-oxo-dGTP pyrophosphatase MutT (NUDIX family)